MEYDRKEYVRVMVDGLDPDFGGYRHLHCGTIFPVDPCGEENLHLVNNVLEPICPACDKYEMGSVLMDFMAWLTTRDSVVEIGASKDSTVVVPLVKEFCSANNCSTIDFSKYSKVCVMPKNKEVYKTVTEAELDNIMGSRIDLGTDSHIDWGYGTISEIDPTDTNKIYVPIPSFKIVKSMPDLGE